MELLEDIRRVIEKLPEDRLREVLDFATFIAQRREDDEWRTMAQEQFTRAYGPNEPEYTEADLEPKATS